MRPAKPWRLVVESRHRVHWRHAGRLRVGRGSCTWTLALACGHAVYRDTSDRYGEKPPKRVRCELCPTLDLALAG